MNSVKLIYNSTPLIKNREVTYKKKEINENSQYNLMMELQKISAYLRTVRLKK